MYPMKNLSPVPLNDLFNGTQTTFRLNFFKYFKTPRKPSK